MNKDCICYWDWQAATVVIDSRSGLARTGMKRRRRQCLTCKRRLTTYELTEEHLDLIESGKYQLTTADLQALESMRSEYLKAMVAGPTKQKKTRRRAQK